MPSRANNNNNNNICYNNYNPSSSSFNGMTTMGSSSTSTEDLVMLSASAVVRRNAMLEAQERARNVEAARKRELRLRRFKGVRKGIKTVGSALWKMTPAKWIEDLERDQELADRMEEMNAEIREEQERKKICREAEKACLEAVQDHLRSFLDERPGATYEDWIEELHPENVLHVAGDKPSIDHRFYVEESDHRILWNESVSVAGDKGTPSPTRTLVPARCLSELGLQ